VYIQERRGLFFIGLEENKCQSPNRYLQFWCAQVHGAGWDATGLFKPMDIEEII